MASDESGHWLRKLLREHPALLLSIVYVAASTVGMVYSWEFLRRFGINVFDYAQIGDFLLASLKEPFTWALVFLAILLTWLDNVIGRRFQRRERPRWLRWYGSERYRSLNALAAVAIVLVFLNVWAGKQAGRLQAGEGRQVRVEFAEGGGAATALLLGTTGQFLFLYDPSTRSVTVHPHESVRAIRLQPVPQ